MSTQIIPPRWLDCPSKAFDYVAGIFMPVKAPLSDKFSIPVKNSFTPATLISMMKSVTPKLGLLVDLTNTTRYYDKDEFESNGISYCKLHRRGEEECPSVQRTSDFIEICLQFRRKHPDMGIVVHCTHGYNRTGFLIVTYLIEVLSWTLKDAINEFARARHPGIFQEDYLEELSRRYKEPTKHLLPMRPNWSARERHENVIEIRKKMPKGIKEVTTNYKLKRIRQKIHDMCNWHLPGFPGVQLETITDTKFVREEAYRVSWKADGTRYMMLINKEKQIFLLDRENRVFSVKNLAFWDSQRWGKHLKNTLVDGELVVEKKGEEEVLTYLIFDVIRFDGEDIGSDFDLRRQFIADEIVYPLVHVNGNKNEPFEVKQKHFFDISFTRALQCNEIPDILTYDCDGLVFQPANLPYLVGRNRRVLKWKPSDLNSIDFRLIINSKRKGLLHVEYSNSPFAEIAVTEKLLQLDGKIVECRCVDGKWKMVRERKDKLVPNSFTVANTVWKAIKSPITEEKLLADIDMFRWKEVL